MLTAKMKVRFGDVVNAMVRNAPIKNGARVATMQMGTSGLLITAHRCEHVEKGDPVDVANLAMMLHQNGQSIQPAAQPQQILEGYKLVPIEPIKKITDAEIEEIAKQFHREDSIFGMPYCFDWLGFARAMPEAAPEPKTDLAINTLKQSR